VGEKDRDERIILDMRVTVYGMKCDKSNDKW
jgi:hypothetical protein